MTVLLKKTARFLSAVTVYQ